MSPENHQPWDRFPVKDKLATDYDTIVAWLAEEMSYSRDKTKGYEEKLDRLGRPPKDPQSVFGFMGGYWHRFRMADEDLADLTDQRLASKSLQALAKVVAGLSDKIALSMWYEQKQSGVDNIDVEPLIYTALEMVQTTTGQDPGRYSSRELDHFIESPGFDGNPMGRAISGLHQTLADQPDNFSKLRDTALGGATAGLLMLKHYANSLKGSGFSVRMPKPGLGSGHIEPW